MKGNGFTDMWIKLPLYFLCNKIGVVTLSDFRREIVYPC